MLLRDRNNPFHKKAVVIALTVGALAALAQPISGDFAAREVARLQPIKFAASEGLFESQRGAPLAIGGIPDVTTHRLRYAIDLPELLSLMTYHDPQALVRGLDSFPQHDWPDPLIPVHLAFQVMVRAGFAMVAVILWAGCLLWRRHTIYDTAWFLRALVAASPLGIIAVEAGWVVTELGRQPWIIYGVMRTAEAVTPMPGLAVSFGLFTILYLFLAVVVAYLLWEQVIESHKLEEATAFAAAGGR